MKRRTRIQYTEADKALMWERWRQGESLRTIARLFDRLPYFDWWDALEERRDTAAVAMSRYVSPGFG